MRCHSCKATNPQNDRTKTLALEAVHDLVLAKVRHIIHTDLVLIVHASATVIHQAHRQNHQHLHRHLHRHLHLLPGHVVLYHIARYHMARITGLVQAVLFVDFSPVLFVDHGLVQAVLIIDLDLGRAVLIVDLRSLRTV